MSSPPVRRRVGNPLRESVRVLGLYIRAQVIVVVVLAVLYAIGFAIGHVPWWPAIAIIGGASTVIPFVGSLIPLALAGITCLWMQVDLVHFSIAFGSWIVIQAFEGFFLTPRLMGKQLGLRPLVVFGALTLAGFVLGPIGILLAVPVLAVLMVFWRYFNDLRS